MSVSTADMREAFSFFCAVLVASSFVGFFLILFVERKIWDPSCCLNNGTWPTDNGCQVTWTKARRDENPSAHQHLAEHQLWQQNLPLPPSLCTLSLCLPVMSWISAGCCTSSSSHGQLDMAMSQAFCSLLTLPAFFFLLPKAQSRWLYFLYFCS